MVHTSARALSVASSLVRDSVLLDLVILASARALSWLSSWRQRGLCPGRAPCRGTRSWRTRRSSSARNFLSSSEQSYQSSLWDFSKHLLVRLRLLIFTICGSFLSWTTVLFSCFVSEEANSRGVRYCSVDFWSLRNHSLEIFLQEFQKLTFQSSSWSLSFSSLLLVTVPNLALDCSVDFWFLINHSLEIFFRNSKSLPFSPAAEAGPSRAWCSCWAWALWRVFLDVSRWSSWSTQLVSEKQFLIFWRRFRELSAWNFSVAAYLVTKLPAPKISGFEPSWVTKKGTILGLRGKKGQISPVKGHQKKKALFFPLFFEWPWLHI